MNVLNMAVLSLVSYILGSFGGSTLCSRILYREKGHIGWREYKKRHKSIPSRLPVVLFDGIKIIAAALMMERAALEVGKSGEFWRLMGAFLSTLGHTYPFFGTRSGGEAMEGSTITSFLMSPYSGFASVIAFLVTYGIWRRKSLSTFVSMVAFPFAFILFSSPSFETGALSILYALMVIGRQKKDMREYFSQ